MTFIIVFMVFVLPIFVVVCIARAISHSKKEKLDEDWKCIISALRKEYNFVCSRKYYSIGKYFCFAVDEVNRQFSVIDIDYEANDSDITVFGYDEIVKYDIYENSNSIVTNDGLSNAIAGGILFGGVGAVVGASTATQKVDSYIEKLTISIVVDREDTKLIRMEMLGSACSRNSDRYEIALKRAKEIEARLAIAIEHNKRNFLRNSQQMQLDQGRGSVEKKKIAHDEPKLLGDISNYLFCHRCGKKNPSDAVFCSGCGCELYHE